MRKLARWIATHRRASSIISFVFWTGMVCVNIRIDGPMWLFFIIAVFGMLMSNVVINTAPVECIKQEVKAFSDHCDPYPLIEAIPELLEYKHTDWIEVGLRLDYGNALAESGQYQSALDQLLEINIDKSPATPNSLKALYYVDLYECYAALEQNEQAEIWYQKAMTIYRDTKEDKLKKSMAVSMAITAGEYALQHDKLEEAMVQYEQAQENTMIERVMRRFLLARILLKQGKTDEARSALEYVVSNGNKLHAVKLAQELLETI